MAVPGQTPSQTVGPYFSMILAHDDDGEEMVRSDTPGQHVVVTGRVLDGERNPIEDALVEVWQANAAGRYRHPADDREELELDDGFTGFGRSKARFEDGTWRVHTVKPGRVPGRDGGETRPPRHGRDALRGAPPPLHARPRENGRAHRGLPTHGRRH